MRPEDTRPVNPLVIPPRQAGSGLQSPARSANRDAAADIVRSQIDSIYHQDPHYAASAPPDSTPPAPADTHTQAAQPQPADSTSDNTAVQAGPGAVNMKLVGNIQANNQQSEAENPYERTHDQTTHQVEASAWQKYHSAWQSYYQQYYERYYVGQVREAKKSLEAQTAVYRGIEPTAVETISTDEAMYDLRSQLRTRISDRAAKVRKSRNFIPIVSAVVVMVTVLLLQYNRVIVAAFEAYIRPSSMNPANIIIDPTVSTVVSSDPRLIIPTISVDVPIVWDADASSQDSLNAAMDNGVAWFNIQGANAKPGQMGNFVLSGHSSNDWLDKGNYKFIFAPLERMKAGDTIYVNYNSTRYTYTITSTKVVKPTDVASLRIGSDKPYITLITCTPLGTALNRLLVFGEQVSPDPNAAATASTGTTPSTTATKMPSNSPTFFQRIFGIGN